MDLQNKRVAVYARYSSDRQSESSIEDQINECRAFVRRAGGTANDSRIASDYATSGTVLARAGLDQVNGWVTGGKIDVLVVWDTKRLNRDIGDSDRLWKLLAFHGVRLLGVSDGLDSNQGGARLQYSIQAVMGDHYAYSRALEHPVRQDLSADSGSLERVGAQRRVFGGLG
jgi:DNA invertase Pin-like site-specific DNA recombinase